MRIGQPVFEPAAFYEGVCLTCPKCTDHYLHQSNVTANNRVKEDRPGTRVLVSGQSVAVSPTTEFLGRRDDVSIAFECEHCGPIGRLGIIQHKGVTIVGWIG